MPPVTRTKTLKSTNSAGACKPNSQTQDANVVAQEPTVVPLTAEEQKKRKQQDRKNAYKRRNKLSNEAQEIASNFKYDHFNIWKAFQAALNDFMLKRTKTNQPTISEMEIVRMCFAYFSLRFRHDLELGLSNYNTEYAGIDDLNEIARDWLIICKKIDTSLIDQHPLRDTVSLYVEMRGRNDRSWRPCFLHFIAFIFSFYEPDSDEKVFSSTLEGTASQEQINEARLRRRVGRNEQ